MYNWFAQKRSTGFLVKNVSDTSKRPKFSLRACKCPSGGTCSRRKLANSPAAQEVILIRYDLRGGFTSTHHISARSGPPHPPAFAAYQ